MAEQFYNAEMARRQEQLAATPDMTAQRRFMLDVMELQAGEQVLDVGSGNGIFVRDMLAKVAPAGTVCGLDSAEPMVGLARHLCPDAEFLLGDAASLPFEAGTFDVVTATQLLCFLPDPDAAIAEMYRVLKTGGRLAILDSDWGSLVWNCRNRPLMERAIAMLTGPYADAHVPRTLSRRLVAAGFKITKRTAFAVLNWTLDPDTYSRQTAGFIESMMKASDQFSDRDWQEWKNDQHAVAEAGEYFFSLNRYVFVASK